MKITDKGIEIPKINGRLTFEVAAVKPTPTKALLTKLNPLYPPEALICVVALSR
jgi:hypothetical protein